MAVGVAEAALTEVAVMVFGGAGTAVVEVSEALVEVKGAGAVGALAEDLAVFGVADGVVRRNSGAE